MECEPHSVSFHFIKEALTKHKQKRHKPLKFLKGILQFIFLQLRFKSDSFIKRASMNDWFNTTMNGSEWPCLKFEVWRLSSRLCFNYSFACSFIQFQFNNYQITSLKLCVLTQLLNAFHDQMIVVIISISITQNYKPETIIS